LRNSCASAGDTINPKFAFYQYISLSYGLHPDGMVLAIVRPCSGTVVTAWAVFWPRLCIAKGLTKAHPS